MVRRSRCRAFRSFWWLVSSSGHCPWVRYVVSSHPNSTSGARTVARAFVLCHSSIPSERHAGAALKRGIACSRPHVSSPSATRSPLADPAPALPGHLIVWM